MQQKDFKKAQEFFQRSLDTFSNLGTYFNLGLAYWETGNFEEAMKYTDQAIQMDPTNLDFLYLKASIYITADKPNEGLHVLQEIVAKDKDYYKAYLLMAKFFQAKNMKGQAIESYKRALEIVERKGLKEEKKEIEARLKELTSGQSP